MGKNECYRPTPDELKGAPRLVLYEWTMLDAAVRAHEDPSRDRRDPCIGSAFADSALLHARNLYKFLTDEPRKKDDILACHFVRDAADASWTSGKFNKSLYHDIDKFRSHLTYRRLQQAIPTWPLPEIRDEIYEALLDFIALLPDSKRDQWPI